MLRVRETCDLAGAVSICIAIAVAFSNSFYCFSLGRFVRSLRLAYTQTVLIHKKANTIRLLGLPLHTARNWKTI